MTFSEKLIELMKKRKMSKSDLARAIWGEVVDYRGYKVAKNRDRIGHYLSGRSLPEKENMAKIAKTLGTTVAELEALRPPPALAGKTGDSIKITVRGLTATMSFKNNINVSLDTANQIIKMIYDDPVYMVS